MKFKSNIELQAGLEDASGSLGTVNQLLSSTATGTAWIDPSAIPSAAATLVVIACKNTSGATIAQGTPVYQTGTVGATTTIEIAPADALISANKLPAIGLLQTELNNNGFGNVVITGELTNFTTDPIDGLTPTVGDKIFVKSGGGLTLTKPTGEGNGIQNMGLVGKVSGGNSGSVTVSSIMRTNDVPNLPEGRIWVGDGNTIVSQAVYIDEPNLRLGIGTTSPAGKLSVLLGETNLSTASAAATTGYPLSIRFTGTASDNNLIRHESSANPTGYYTLMGTRYDNNKSFVINNKGSEIITYSDITSNGLGLSGGAGNLIRFTTNSSERMRITSTGNVGIGTTSPSTTLDVNGIVTATGGNSTQWNTAYDNSITTAAVTGTTTKTLTLTQQDAGTITTSWTDNDTDTNYYTTTATFNTADGVISFSGAGGQPAYSVDLDGRYAYSSDLSGYVTLGTAQTITGQKTFNSGSYNPLRLDRSATNINLSFNHSGVLKGYLGVGAGGTLTWGTNADSNTNSLIWNASNDGAGSGLDADLLDGQQGSYYAPATGGNYLPLSAGSSYPLTGDLYVGTSTASTDRFVRTYHSDNSYTEMRGYGIITNRTTAYVRPVGDKTQVLTIGNDGHTWNYVSQNANYHTFSKDTSEWMRIDITGNVGIGTTSPTEKLQVNGNIKLSSEAPIINATSTNNSSGLRYNTTGTAGDTHRFQYNGTTQLNIKSSGNVGIGTTAPAYKLDVAGTGRFTDNLRVQKSANPTLELFDSTHSVVSIIGDSGTFNVSNQSVGSVIFAKYDGNVGIGTTNPTYKLDVSGTIRATGTVTAPTFSGALSGNASTATTSNAVNITGYGNGNFTFYQTSGTFAGYSGWANYFIGSHGNGSNYYNTIHIMPFWSAPKYSRLEGGAQTAVYDYWTSEGVINSDHAVNAPIFYDSNNTGYYTDPASNSHFNTITTAGTVRVGSGFYVGDPSDTSTDIYMEDGDEGQRRIHCNSNRIGFLTSSNGWGSYCTDNGDWTTDFISYAGASMRAPLFYDNNNTGYYIDGASTSSLNSLNVNALDIGGGNIAVDTTNGFVNSGPWTRNQTPYGYIDFGPANAGTAHIYTDRPSFYFNKTVLVLGGSQINQSDIRASIFYDVDNTGYYLNPNSTSNLNTVTAAQFNGPLSGNASTATTATQSNAVNLTGYGNNNFTVYQTSGTFAGYSGWANYFIGNHGNGSNYYNTIHIMPFWSAPKYSRLEGGAQTAVYDYWTSEGVINSDHAVNAPIFYDSNNTGYYVDPASTSNVNVITAAGTMTATNFILSSDERKKTKIKDLSCDNIDISWKSFEMKSDEGEYRVGVIAQELEVKHPEFVNTDSEGFKSVKYIDLLISKIAELEARLEKAGI